MKELLSMVKPSVYVCSLAYVALNAAAYAVQPNGYLFALVVCLSILTYPLVAGALQGE